MTINELLLSTITPILSNVWADELPVDATFPAIVFEVVTESEKTWVLGGGYDQHAVTLYFYTKTLPERTTLEKAVREALQALPSYLIDGERGDAEYEEDASVYAYFSDHVIRLPLY